MKKLLSVVACMMLFVGISLAEEVTKSETKFSLGYSKIAVNAGEIGTVDFDQAVGRFTISNDMAIEVSLGFNTGDNITAFALGGKLMGNIITKNKLNIYWLAGLNFGSISPKNVDSGSIFRIYGGLGAEYYVIPQISILTEMGVRFQSSSVGGGDSVSGFGLFADWLPQAGIRYHF